MYIVRLKLPPSVLLWDKFSQKHAMFSQKYPKSKNYSMHTLALVYTCLKTQLYVAPCSICMRHSCYFELFSPRIHVFKMSYWIPVYHCNFGNAVTLSKSLCTCWIFILTYSPWNNQNSLMVSHICNCMSTIFYNYKVIYCMMSVIDVHTDQFRIVWYLYWNISRTTWANLQSLPFFIQMCIRNK